MSIGLGEMFQLQMNKYVLWYGTANENVSSIIAGDSAGCVSATGDGQMCEEYAEESSDGTGEGSQVIVAFAIAAPRHITIN